MRKLHHFVWYPIPGKGYQDRPLASSGNFNPFLFTSVFRHEFIPIIVSYSKENFRGYLFFNRPNRSQFLFSCLFPKKRVDEYGRTGVFHHSAIIERNLLERGEISLFAVEKAMREFEENNPFPKGNIEQLEVPQNETPYFEYPTDLKNYVSKAAVETLATCLMSSDKKIIFRCLGASPSDRLKIAIYLVELLNFNCGIRPISFSTEVPITSEYYRLFDVLVLERAYPPETDAEEWEVILWDLENPLLPKLKNRDEVYNKIDAAFS